jgi:predicted glycosyltransferase
VFLMPAPSRGPRPTLLFYCQHSVGLGHLVRSLALAGGLAERFEVVFLSGGPLPPGLERPPGVELVTLPPLGHDAAYALVSRDPRWTVQQAMRERTERIQAAFDAAAPRVVLVELFPFGRKKFAFELLPLLERARSAPQRPLVVCSLRDILVGRRRDQRKHDQRAAELANRHLDAVLVHADPRFARLEESFHPSTPLRVPVHYTGFVRDGGGRLDPPPRRHQRVLVSAGGGLVGEPLLRAAVAAQPALLESEGLTTTVVAGPFLPEPAWRWLTRAARRRPALRVHRYLPGLAGEMAASRLSVSQCGYNTAMDILACGTPAVVVPFAEGREDEQTVRARRLERLGVLRVVEAGELDAGSLVEAAGQMLRRRPPRLDLDLDGRANTAELVATLAGAPPAPPDAAGAA